MLWAVALAALLVAAGVAALLPGGEDGPDPLEEAVEPLVPDVLERGPEGDAAPVRFLAWGDAGHGTPAQADTAEAARRVCEREGCDLVVGLGDNIYDNGVEHVHDDDFERKFESPYQNLSLPFYMVLGNHDVRGNASAQVAYTNVSDKWNMPGRSYWFQQGGVVFVGLDLTRLDEGDDEGADRLGAWVEEQLARPAAWRVVYSHFPYASNGKHGNGSEELRAFLERHVCGKADLYLAGHDHDLQWLEEQPACPGTELVISGAASQARPLAGEAVRAHFARGETRGFFWFEATEDALTGRAYDAEGTVLYERAVRRSG
ncbi:MAG TPA: metallophosphoesterase [Candidatus Thermoplasmatota archaeon]|nr:metallophosphoesterase [Candidatus Thermoplasmatota archaeon]